MFGISDGIAECRPEIPELGSKVFWCFQKVQNMSIGQKRVNIFPTNAAHLSSDTIRYSATNIMEYGY